MLDLYHFKKLPTYAKVTHAVSTKSSAFPYHFSLALHTGESPKDIIGNRKILKESLKIPHTKTVKFIVANQTHSANIQVIQENKSRGWESKEDAIENCDALITDVKYLILTILTADCVPILLYDKEKQVIAIIHAGWKGTEAQITKKTIQKMQKVFKSNPKEILASIAPSIGRCCYEVELDVAKHFLHIPQSYTQKANKYMLDLPMLNQKQLLDSGIEKDHIEMSDICTSCEVERFFSYRKEKGCTGRFMSLIGLFH